MRVVVVGAGLAGLAAVCELADRGHEVTLVERGRLLGGKATSFVVDGVEVDNGQHVHLACCSDYLDFVDRLGLAAELWTQPRFEVTVLRPGARPARLRAGRGLPPSLALVPSFAGYSALGPRAKWQVLRALRRVDDRVPADETFAAWLSRHGQGRQAITGFWDLFVVPALNAEAHEVSAADALFVVRTAFGDPRSARIGWARVPLARIAEVASRRASRVMLRTGVVGLEARGTEVEGVRCGDGQVIEADAVVLAVPPARLAAILGDDRLGVEGLERFTSRAIVDVHLWFDVAGSLGLTFAAIAGSPVQWVFEKRPGYLCCSLSAADTLVGRPERELIELCREEVAKAWPRLASVSLLRGAVTRDPEATFVPAPGLVRPGPATASDNVAIAGAWTDTGWPATMESAVRSGRAAAAVLATAPARRGLALEPVHG